MQLTASLILGLPALFSMAAGGYHLAYGRLFPWMPGVTGEVYGLLMHATGFSYRTASILLLLFGGLAFFFAFLLYPRR